MSLIFRYRWLIFIMLCALCLMGTPYLKQSVVPDNEVKSWFDADDPSLHAYNAFQQDFGNDRIINLAFGEDSGILQTATLRKIDSLTQSLHKIEGVCKVWSVTNVADFRRVRNGDSFRLCYCSWFEEHPDYQIEDSLRQEILSSSFITNRFVHENGKLAMLIVQLEAVEEVESRMAAIIAAIDSTSTGVLGEGQFHLMGTDIITTGLNQLSEQDFIRFTGLSFGSMFILVLAFYRKVSYLLLVLSTVFFSVWATLSIYGLFGLRINIFTVMTPPLIMVLGIIIVMHILNEDEVQASTFKGKPGERVRKTLMKVGPPCFFASLTTMLGFLSVLVTDMAILREFGVFTALGIFFTLLFSLFFSILILPMQQYKEIKTGGRRVGIALAGFATHILKRPTFYWSILFMVAGLSLAGVMRIRVDMYPIGYFPGDHRLVQDHAFYLNQWGPYYPVDLAVRTDSMLITDPVMVRAIMAFEKEVKTHPQIHQTMSYVQALERFARVMYQQDLQTVMANPLLVKPFALRFKRLVKEDDTALLVRTVKAPESR